LSFSAESIVLKVALFTCGIFSVCTVYVARKKWLVDYVKSLAALSGDKKLKLESAWKKKLNVSLLVKAVRFATFLAGLVSTYYVMMYIYENYPS
jgi:hypothetical protein